MSLIRTISRDRVDQLGEGLLWSARDKAVYWTDIIGQRLNRLRLADDRIDSWAMPEMIGWVIERRDAPGFIAGFQSGIAMLTLDPLTVTPLAAPEPDMTGNRLNDAVADAHGRLWLGTMPIGCDIPSGSLYRFDPDHSVTKIDTGYTVTNGPAISADGQWLYHTDSPIGRVYRFPLDQDGTVGPREDFIIFDPDWGSPDGMTVDAVGGLWIAHWGGSCISRFTPAGQRERLIALPASQITNIVFAGDALDRMFVTSAADGVDEPLGGALFEVAPGVCGLPAQQFAG
ncbi:SMP-30/gluconolactonase/LRE family protein [Sphingomonas sp. 28-63-12]|uniref:SMP-30/gluconolactonase/LRE family protein n=1 Tax=Sphingomonas sp. 28-63-12 TaxID=1970434 RepID=UPI000BC80692|nr:MAG: gluconolaconase [Sphingomonas sp. 28-63-12]